MGDLRPAIFRRARVGTFAAATLLSAAAIAMLDGTRDHAPAGVFALLALSILLVLFSLDRPGRGPTSR